MANIYHVKVNSNEYEIQAISVTESITLALTQYTTDLAAEPDACTVDANQGICVCSEFAGELVPDPA